MDWSGLHDTCSMAEIGGIWRDSMAELSDVIRDAKEDNRQALIVNLSDKQYKLKEIRQAIQKAGFRRVGTYTGNSSMTVHVFLKGVTPCRATKSKR